MDKISSFSSEGEWNDGGIEYKNPKQIGDFVIGPDLISGWLDINKLGMDLHGVYMKDENYSTFDNIVKAIHKNWTGKTIEFVIKEVKR